MITFTCPHCRQTLTVPEGSAGKKGKCPQCGNLVDIPAASTAEPFAPPPEPAPVPPDLASPMQPEVADAGPSGGFLLKPTMEFAVTSMILGGLALLATPGIVTARLTGIFPAVLMGMADMGLAGLGLVLAIFALLRILGRRSQAFWYVITALVISGIAVLISLTMFIAVMAMGK
jgi:hypothetical protein